MKIVTRMVTRMVLFKGRTLPSRGVKNDAIKDSGDLYELPLGGNPGIGPKPSSEPDKAGIRTRDPSEIPIYMDRGPGNVESFQIPTAVIREWLI